MAALAIVRRDLVRYLRNPVRTAMLFAVPLMLSGIFALVFGGGGADQISIKVLLFDEDESLLSKFLEGAGGSSEMDQRLDIVAVGAEGYEMMDRGEASALVHLPKGFTSDYLAGLAHHHRGRQEPVRALSPEGRRRGRRSRRGGAVGGIARVPQRVRTGRYIFWKRLRSIGPRSGVGEHRVQPEIQERRAGS